MCAKSLCEAAMLAVAQAREWAVAMVKRESRGPGDKENAMKRLANRHDIPWRAFLRNVATLPMGWLARLLRWLAKRGRR